MPQTHIIISLQIRGIKDNPVLSHANSKCGNSRSAAR